MSELDAVNNVFSHQISGVMLENEEIINNTIENAEKYLKSGFQNTYYLGYRDIPYFIKKHVTGKRALDYGCGTGRSTNFLKKMGFETLGVDISKEMLSQAVQADPLSHYLLIKNAQLPVLGSSLDLIFSCFVFLTMSSKQEILAVLKEAYRTLKNGGIFIIVTASEELYSHEWLSYDVNYPENAYLKSGNKARICLKDLGIEFINYYWTDADYCDLFDLAQFQLLEKHFPLGKSDENQEWISEEETSPYVVYVLQKNEEDLFFSN